MEEELEKMKEAAKSDPSITVQASDPPPHYKKWKAARIKDGKYINAHVAEVAAKIDELEAQSSQGSFTPSTRMDILSMMIGKPDNLDHVRGELRGVSAAKYFGRRRRSSYDNDNPSPQLVAKIRAELQDNILRQLRANGLQAQRKCQKLGFDHFDFVEADGLRGGIWVAWNQAHFNFKSKQFVHAMAENENDENDASPNQITRRQLWSLLEEFHPSQEWPWIIGGDFNVTLFHHEHRSTAQQPRSVDKGFLYWVENSEVTSLGSNHTIDQFFSNAPMRTFIEDRNDPLRFIASWALHEDFDRLMKDTWDLEAEWDLNVDYFTSSV
ncbi:hypothetical protein K1719_008909 [Acacia pycnantha]|nr:hypothetical protein K1719_008909 [Acacia pycnantha]